MIPVTVFAASDGSGVSESVSLLLPAYAVHFDKPGGGPWRRGGTWALVSWDLAALLCEASGNAMLGLLGLLGCPRHGFDYLKKARALFMCVRERGMTLYAGLALSQVQL